MALFDSAFNADINTDFVICSTMFRYMRVEYQVLWESQMQFHWEILWRYVVVDVIYVSNYNTLFHMITGWTDTVYVFI